MRSLLLLLLAGQLLTAQSTLRIGAFAPPQTLDPCLTSQALHFIYFFQIYESPLECVTDEDSQVRVRPAICALPEVSDDGLTLRFKLSAAGRFHDDPCFPGGKGRAIAIRDVAYMFLHHADPFVKSVWWGPYLAGRIKGLDAWRERSLKDGLADYDAADVPGLKVQGDTLIVTLLRPYPQLAPLLTQTWAAILPREAVERYGPAFGDSHPVGSGPFRFVKKDVLGTVFLRRHVGYRIKGRPGVDEVRIVQIASGDQQVKRFIAGELDVCAVTVENEAEFLNYKGAVKTRWRRKGVSLVTGPSLDVSYLTFNCRNRFFKDKRIRQAATLCIARKRRMKKLWGVRGLEANSPLPPGFPEARLVEKEPYSFRRRNVGRARKLLEQAGHPGGKGLPEFILDVPGASPQNMEIAKGMVKDLAEGGFRFQINGGSFGEWFQRAQRADFQMAWVAWFADYPDAENFLGLLAGSRTLDKGGYNYGAYQNATIDRLYARFCTLRPGSDRDQVAARMLGILRDDCPWIYFAHGREVYLLAKGVTGLVQHHLGRSLRDVEVVR